MFFSRPFQWYHSHVDLIWPDGTFKGHDNLLRLFPKDFNGVRFKLIF